jgi:hypothetical protein
MGCPLDVRDSAAAVTVEDDLSGRHHSARAIRPPLAASHLAIRDTTKRLLVAARTQALVFRQLGQPRASDSWPIERHSSESVAAVGGTPELGEGLTTKGDHLELEAFLTMDAAGELDDATMTAVHNAVRNMFVCVGILRTQ